MSLARYCSGILVCWLHTQCAPQGPTTAPNPTAKAVNQLTLSRNACGPAATVNALRFGAPAYQAAAKSIPGNNDRSHLRHIIAQQGSTWSNHVPQRYRWSNRGINAADLTDVTNELIKPYAASPVKLRIPSGTNAFHQSYKQLAQSLRRGFPPVVGMRRYDGARTIDSHFITILQVPDRLDKDSHEFPIRYLDPMGARTLQGVIRAQHGKMHTQLIAETPSTYTTRGTSKSSAIIMDALIVAP